jgi:cytochrome c biogenesis protein CcmG, thiol:disulfide interchange protein DsbE
MSNPNDQPDQDVQAVETTAVPNRINPMLLLFLIFPVIGIIAALLTSRPASTGIVGTLQPPPAYFTSTSRVGSPAPDFTLQTLNGQPIRLSSLRGKWVLLNFWATWCGPCRREMPTFQKLLNGGFGNYQDKITVLAVNRVETPEKIKSFLNELGLNVPVALDTDAAVNNLYGVLNLPVTMVVDPQGVIFDEVYGEVTAEHIQLYLEKIGSAVEEF